MMIEVIMMAQLIVTFLIGFIVGLAATDLALKKKTGKGIIEYLPYDSKTMKPLVKDFEPKKEDPTTDQSIIFPPLP